jgi:uncharacterized protein (TIGR02145 family)
MEKKFWYCVLIIIIIGTGEVIFLTGCEKDENKPEIEYGAATDIDGNVYDAVNLGSQSWFTENLKTSNYSNGDPIATGLSDDDWYNTTSGAFAIYNNDIGNNSTYGKLYNWAAAVDSRNICPVGWHVPSDSEWATLVDYLGGESIAGGKLKEAGTSHWNDPNEASDKSKFSALPGGQRTFYGSYAALGDYGYWWTTTEGFADGSWGYSMVNSENFIKRLNYTKEVGFSVRCIKD